MTINKNIFWFVALTLISNSLLSSILVIRPNSHYEFFLLGLNIIFCVVLLGYVFVLRNKTRKSIFTETPNAAPEQLIHDSTVFNKGYYSNEFIIKNFANVMCIKDSEGRWLAAKASYLGLYNLQNADFYGKTDHQLCEIKDCNAEALQKSAIQDKLAWEYCQSISDNTASISPYENKSQTLVRNAVYDENKEKYRLFITDDFQQSDALEKPKSNLFTSLFYNNHLPFLILNTDFTINQVNRSFEKLTGFAKSDLKNKRLSFLYATESVKNYESSIRNFFNENGFLLWTSEMNCRLKNGDAFSAKVNISPIKGKNSQKIQCFCVQITDNSQQKIIEKRIMRLAHFDNLTGLPNRIMFCDNLTKYLSAAKRHKLNTVVLFLDLDRFKTVNDSFGHHVGDALLKATAKRISAILRKEDVVSRFSGDEFAILLLNEHSHEKAIYSVSMIAKKIISELSKPFNIQHHELFVGTSIGIAIYPENAESAENLLKNADIAMYEAKKKGGNNFEFFDSKITIAKTSKHNLEIGLRKALSKDELRLVYQPQYKTNSEEICGAEVLVRWYHNQTKMIPPDYFIPIAEETGLIIPIGKWILESACEQQKLWLDEGHGLKQISVNISARQFMSPDFVEIVENVLKKTALDAKYLELEITESMLIGDINRIEIKLRRLKKMGVKIALDDFGTGYSSLSYLKKFPIDVLKIDQSFIKEITFESKDASIACAIIEMGHSLDLKVVAEGVEDENQYSFLKQRGCDIIQGYYFNPALPAHEMRALLMSEEGINFITLESPANFDLVAS